MIVLSRLTASILTRMHRSRCSCANSLSNTPALAQPFIWAWIVYQSPKRFGSARPLAPFQIRLDASKSFGGEFQCPRISTMFDSVNRP